MALSRVVVESLVVPNPHSTTFIDQFVEEGGSKEGQERTGKNSLIAAVAKVQRMLKCLPNANERK